MFSRSSHLPFLVVLVTGLGLFLGARPAKAASADEIISALGASSSAPVATVSKKVFLRAWSAVIAGVDEPEQRDYVSAAVELRPDLAPNIVERALSILIEPKKSRPNATDARIVREVVQSAVRILPKQAASIVAAALAAQPNFRADIVAAATFAAPDQRQAIVDAAAPYSLILTWLRLSEKTPHLTGGAVSGSVNPANIDVEGNRDEIVRSPEKAP